MTTLRWLNLIDFVVLTLALYAVLNWARQARAMRLAFWIVGLYAVSLVARHFDLLITSWVLDAASVGLIVMLLMIFQPELRRAFLRLDNLLRVSPRSPSAFEPGYRAISEASFAMARERIGALIVIVRDDPVAESVEGGVVIGADISRKLLEALFQKTSPLHDGAAIIENGRIARAGVILPLSHRPDVPHHFGTRHRAAMGLAERSDALVIAVSEERGEVSLMRVRSWRVAPSAAELLALLEKLQAPPRISWTERMVRAATRNMRVKLTAAGLGVLLWVLSFFASGITIRTVTVPVEFSNVPRGLNVVESSANSLEVSLRGRTWVMESTNPAGLVAQFDLRGRHEGPARFQPTARNLNLPPGVALDGVEPPVVSVKIQKQ